MKRVYNNGEQVDVSVFMGTEVEHTPAYGQETLFVVGLQDSNKIIELSKKLNVSHIYLGANQSFDGNDIEEWEKLAKSILDLDKCVTLDFDVKFVINVLEMGLNEYDMFIPLISVKIPYLSHLNYNASIKLDDSGFRKSNPGVWVHQLNDLLDRAKFTNWASYRNDWPIERTETE